MTHRHFNVARRIAALSMAASSVVAVAACSHPPVESSAGGPGSSGAAAGESPTATPSDAARAAAPKALLDKGNLVIVMDTSAPPVHFSRDGSTTPVGLDADLGVAIAEVLGLTPNVVAAQFDAIMPGLAAGKYDVAVEQMTPTKQRLEVLDFVNYGMVGDGLLVAKGNPLGITATSLCGKRIGVLKGAYQDVNRVAELDGDCAKSGQPNIQKMTYPDMQAPVLALQSGRIDGALIDGPAASYVSTQSEQVEMSEEIKKTTVGIATPKGNHLVDAMEAALKALKEQGVYQKIFEKWNMKSNTVDVFSVNEPSS